MSGVTVACVLRSGGDYGPEYVKRLRAGVGRHLPGAVWVCLSDVPEAATHPLQHGWPGWWSKMELFTPGLLTGPTLYLDLDTVVVGDLADIAAAVPRDGFAMLQDFTRPDGYGSGVMGWFGDWSRLYSAFAADPAGHQARYATGARWGDQAFIRDHIGCRPATWQDAVPRQIVSYKVHGRTADARLVCFHGRPRPAEVDWQA
ncbi:MAG: hypothetical protein U5L06_00620 [Rhodovibrio sp.]|nr:hypothetical protein [Rhodovibrio sp.]